MFDVKVRVVLVILSWSLFACSSPEEAVIITDDDDVSTPDADRVQDVGTPRDDERTPRGDEGTPRDDEETPPDDEWDENCHWDCFADFRCDDGRVFETPHGPLPCDDATEENLRYCREGAFVGECAEGCATVTGYGFDPFADHWTIACEEGRPRVVGDSCEIDADCQPEFRSRYTAAGEAQNLRCDEESKTCRDERYPDFGSPCGLSELEQSSDRTTFFADAPDCDEGHCHVHFLSEEQTFQRCTLPCEGSGDCPAGSLCADMLDLVTADAYPAHQRRVQVCVSYVLDSLACSTL